MCHIKIRCCQSFTSYLFQPIMLLEEAFEGRIYSQQTRQELVLFSWWETRLNILSQTPRCYKKPLQTKRL